MNDAGDSDAAHASALPEAASGIRDAELFEACGLPSDPSPEAIAAFDLAAILLQDGHCPLAAVALATAVAKGGRPHVQSLPFGYAGPTIDHIGWVRREDLTRWLMQCGVATLGSGFDADAARCAVATAIEEYWLETKRFNEWRPGMKRGSGHIEVVHSQPAGMQLARETAAGGHRNSPPEGRHQKLPLLPGPSGLMGVADLAKAFAIPADKVSAFKKRLERDRRSLGDGAFEEVQNPRPNAPRFLYNAGHHRVRQIAAEYDS
jgi:hypothetical protein